MTTSSLDKRLCPHCRNHPICLDYGYNPPEPYCLYCGWRENPPPDMFIKNYPALYGSENAKYTPGYYRG